MHKDSIHSLFVPSKRIKLPSCHSTNQVASDLLAEKKLEEGAVIVTDNQTAGRGQRGNKWESEPGKNITLSIVVKPVFLPISSQFELTVITSLAVLNLLSDFDLKDPKIKWPNDIYIGSSKIGGILIENMIRSNQLEWAIIGIGLNVNQEEFKVANATSMKLETGAFQPLEPVINHLLSHMDRYYSWLKQGKSMELRVLYAENLMWVNQPGDFLDINKNIRFQGRITGVNDEGRLVVKSDEGEQTFDFKQITFLG